jgi:uncharacterized protein with HEPN domain
VNNDRVYLEHIRDALNDLASYSSAGREAFFAERMRQDATLRKLEVIGQAVKNLSNETKSRQPEIPWRRIAGMRDKVIHGYFGVNLEIVWVLSKRSCRNFSRQYSRSSSNRNDSLHRSGPDSRELRQTGCAR